MHQYLQSLQQQAQIPPYPTNPFLYPPLQTYLQHFLTPSPSLTHSLHSFGERLTTLYQKLAQEAERNPPQLEQFDAYGNRIDRIHTSSGWKGQHRLAAEDQIVALAYKQSPIFGEMQRFVQMFRLIMYQPFSGMYGCPLAMTDGAAFTLKTIMSSNRLTGRTLHHVQQAFNRLTTSDPQRFWTSGQWMTEKKGGSDVSQTETVAMKVKNKYRLYGYKWFSSATESDVSLALAKIIPSEMNLTQQNVKDLPLSLFLVKLKDRNGKLKRIQIMKLKDKLGTRQLATAELLLKGAKGYLISMPGEGVKAITPMLNITRMYNSCTACGYMLKINDLVVQYAKSRTIKDVPILSLPLQASVLADLQITSRASLILTLKLAQLLSKHHYGSATTHQLAFLRLMTPVCKLLTAKQCVRVCSEGIEALGGIGYIQSSGLPSLLRDGQVLPIWEGTTNVLTYDFLRALKGQDSLIYFTSYKNKIFQLYNTFRRLHEDKSMFPYISKLILSSNGLFSDMANPGRVKAVDYRILSLGAGQVMSALLLLECFMVSKKQEDELVFRRYVDSRQLYGSARWGELDYNSLFGNL